MVPTAVGLASKAALHRGPRRLRLVRLPFVSIGGLFSRRFVVPSLRLGVFA